MNCFLRELGKQITNIGENIEHDTNLDNHIFLFFFPHIHNISIGDNVEVEIMSKKG